MWQLDHKEGWAPKNWRFWTLLEKTLKSLLLSKEIKPIDPKGNQLWIFIGRTDAQAEAPVIWPLYAKCQLTTKDPGTGKEQGQEEKGMAEDECDDWMASLIQWTWVWGNSRKIVKGREAWCAAVHGITKSQILLSNWTPTSPPRTVVQWERGAVKWPSEINMRSSRSRDSVLWKTRTSVCIPRSPLSAEKKAQPKSWELCFIRRTNVRTQAWDTAFPITLRNSSQEVRGRTRICRRFFIFATKDQIDYC